MMDYQEAIYCMKVMAEEAVCEECNFYHSCDHSKQADMARIAISAMQELQQYKQLGTLEEVREAVEKQQADKPRIFRLSAHGVPDGYLYSCPNCEYGIIKKDNRGFYSGPRTKYCPDCGKRLDWSEENEID